tara:strand:+ start:388 stop:540 length:153 start_codon:yes stop_codon:yes gene_type:complete
MNKEHLKSLKLLDNYFKETPKDIIEKEIYLIKEEIDLIKRQISNLHKSKK